VLKALLWDVDGTLAETERDGHRLAFNRAFASMGLDWRWDEALYGELLRVTGGRERILAYMGRVGHPGPMIEHESLARQLHALKNGYYAECIADGAIPLRPGVRELIDEAAAAGLRQAIVTTTSRGNVEALLGRHFGPGWHGRFAALVCGEDVARKKPDPEAHRRALAALGLVAGEALAIEDSLAGLSAACAAGVPTILTRSVYFGDDPADGALAAGPGFGSRAGWTPAPPPGAGPIGLGDLKHWLAPDPRRFLYDP
jgi:HAD superfamily hydrolase (TIGR01509 family)